MIVQDVLTRIIELEENKMKKLQANVAAPLYQQLYDTILEKINQGKYQTGDKIPSEEQLSKMYDISRITVRSAIKKLCDDNVLVKKHGKGTFVSMPVYIDSNSAEGSFTKSCLQLGQRPSTQIIKKGSGKANEKIAKHLGIDVDEKVIHLERLRLIDDCPTILEEDYFIGNFSFMLTDEVEGKPLLDVIREHTGHKAEYFDDMMEVRYATKEQAKYLNCVTGTPLLYVSQLVVGKNNQVLYYNEQFIRSDIYKFSVRSMNK